MFQYAIVQSYELVDEVGLWGDGLAFFCSAVMRERKSPTRLHFSKRATIQTIQKDKEIWRRTMRH
jgi:hypothetical protein